ncbi:Imm1 family immunity protein [Amycolatopsis sp. NPDC051071]|uniref:Imm1 family immunity protein n=1 Tax=Amycolatopsis sp. NPDC051071 TaxID=3154637 RepID=UPI003449C25B
MVEVDVYYDWSANTPTTVSTPAELDAVLDNVAATGSPQVAQLVIHGDPRRGMLDVGLHAERARGALYFAGGQYRRGCVSHGPETASEDVIYVYMGNAREFPATAEVPIADARKAAHEFMAAGGERPKVVAWSENL